MAKTKSKTSSPAAALLDAHVAHVLARLEGEPLRMLIETEVDAALKNAAKLKLDDVVTRDMIKQTACIYASELELGGGIPELVGDIGRSLYSHPIHAKTRIGDLLPDRLFEETLDKLLEMKEPRERLIHEAVSNPLYSALVSDLLFQGIKDYLADSSVTSLIPGAQTMFKLGRSAMNKATPKLEASIEQTLRKTIGRNIAKTLRESERFLLKRIGDKQFHESALDAWAVISKQPVGAFRRVLSSEDVEDFFVLGYEAWRALRKTVYYKTLIDAGIDCFFDKYGKTTLLTLLGEVGIDREHIVADAMRFGPHVLGVLKKKKMLEPVVRRNLEGFYASEAVAKILGSGS